MRFVLPQFVTPIILVTIIIILAPLDGVKAEESYYSVPGQIRIAEINPAEDLVKLCNMGNTTVDLAGWVFYDDQDTHELFITLPDILVNNVKRDNLLLYPGEEMFIFDRNDTDFLLNKEGGEVRLFSGPGEIGGTLEDQIEYPKITKGLSYKVFFESEIQSQSDSFDYNNDSTQLTPLNSNFLEGDEEKQYYIPESSSQKPGNDLINKKEIDDDENIKKNDKNSDSGNSESDNGNFGNSKLSQINLNLNRNIGINIGSDQVTNFDAGPNTDTNLNKNNNTNSTTFTASSKMEKSSPNFFYRIMGNWFLWRIILPMFVLWGILYFAACHIKKKFLSE